jgi:hypothetical protein
MLVTLESERLKVTALNLFHPIASPPFQGVGFFILRHSLFGERGEVRGTKKPRIPINGEGILLGL